MSDELSTGPVTSDVLREASFPQARKGYDQQAVHALLNRVADWLDAQPDAEPQASEEIVEFGERTKGILAAAEEAAAKMRSEAKEYAQRVRSSADEETRNAQTKAREQAQDVVTEAEKKAEGIIHEARVRRRSLNQALASLTERRDAIASEAKRLADQLNEVVHSLRVDATAEDNGDGARPAAREGAPAAGGDSAAQAERDRLRRAGFEVAAKRD
jgi:DivIVA domain-containing protein